MKKTQRSFLTPIILSSLFFFAGGYLFWHWYNWTRESLSQGLFEETKNILDTYLATPSQEVIDGKLIHAFVDSYGDKYTEYFSPEEVLSFQTMMDGDFEGIGAYVEESPNWIYISGVLPGSPAQESGLLPGDIIQSVDGETMHAKTADEAVKKIRWPAGTTVVLGVFSSILGTKKQVTLFRRHLEIPIISDELKNDILIIRLLSFNDHSRDDVEGVLKKNAGKYRAILLDLRNNGGGTLQSSVDVGSLFLSSGKVIATVDGSERATYVSHGEKDLATPLYLLVNGQTASAAEILASALHVHLKAPLLGSQTYGKWSVQQIFSLSNGAEMKVTIAHWRTADNILLDKVGLTPSTVILPTPAEITEGKDGQLEKSLKVITDALWSQK